MRSGQVLREAACPWPSPRLDPWSRNAAALVSVPSCSEGPYSWLFGKQVVVSSISDPNSSNSGSLVTLVHEEAESEKHWRWDNPGFWLGSLLPESPGCFVLLSPLDCARPGFSCRAWRLVTRIQPPRGASNCLQGRCTKMPCSVQTPGARGQRVMVKPLIWKDAKSKREDRNRHNGKSGFRQANRKPSDSTSPSSMGLCVAGLPSKGSACSGGSPPAGLTARPCARMPLPAIYSPNAYLLHPLREPWAPLGTAWDAGRVQRQIQGSSPRQGCMCPRGTQPPPPRHTHTEPQCRREAVKCQVWVLPFEDHGVT